MFKSTLKTWWNRDFSHIIMDVWLSAWMWTAMLTYGRRKLRKRFPQHIYVHWSLCYCGVNGCGILHHTYLCGTYEYCLEWFIGYMLRWSYIISGTAGAGVSITAPFRALHIQPGEHGKKRNWQHTFFSTQWKGINFVMTQFVSVFIFQNFLCEVEFRWNENVVEEFSFKHEFQVKGDQI